MVLKIDSAELDVTNDLLSDFAANSALTAEKVYRTSWSRYNTLPQFPIQIIFTDESINHQDIYEGLPKFIHQFIYRELFTFQKSVQ